MRLSLPVALVAAMTLLGTSVSFADKPADPKDNRSSCGAVHAADASVNGNFGFLGALGGTPGYHDGATGQDPGATGYNNSHTNCHDSE